MEQEKKETGEGGLGLGLGVDLNLKLDLVKNLVHTLNSALQETGSTLTNVISDIAHKIKDMAPGQLKQEAQQGGFEDQYNQLVSNLQEAANRGEQEASNLLNKMGETFEESKH